MDKTPRGTAKRTIVKYGVPELLNYWIAERYRVIAIPVSSIFLTKGSSEEKDFVV